MATRKKAKAKKKVVKKTAVKKKHLIKKKPPLKLNKTLGRVTKPGFGAMEHPGSGRTPGPNQSTIEIRNRLKELNCDPLEWAVKFLEGEDTPQAHPFLNHLRKLIKQLTTVHGKIRRGISQKKPELPPVYIMTDFLEIITELDRMGTIMLGAGTWLDPKIRASIATNLLNYIYPKQQTIQHHNEIVNPTTPVDQLTDQNLVVIVNQIIEKKMDSKDLEKLRDELKTVDTQ